MKLRNLICRKYLKALFLSRQENNGKICKHHKIRQNMWNHIRENVKKSFNVNSQIIRLSGGVKLLNLFGKYLFLDGFLQTKICEEGLNFIANVIDFLEMLANFFSFYKFFTVSRILFTDFGNFLQIFIDFFQKYELLLYFVIFMICREKTAVWWW